jgi:hypothetical protein
VSTHPLTIRRVPLRVHEVLEQAANREFRSKQAQALMVLSEWAEQQPLMPTQPKQVKVQP